MKSIRPLVVFLALAIASLVAGYRVFEPLDMVILDRQFSFVRQYRPQNLADDVVVVGIDERSFANLREPFALWHPHLGKFLRAMAIARPSVLGIDIALPEHSYQFLIPQYDLPLLGGLAEVRAKVPIFIAQPLDQNGDPRPIFAPYISLAGSEALASVTVCLDSDGVVRRLTDDKSGCPIQVAESTLSAKMAGRIGIHNVAGDLIDYTAGPPIRFVPFHEVLDWYDQNNYSQLNSTFKGKPVLLGINLPYSDRHRLPVALLDSEPGNRRVPGVLIHAQALRSYLNHGMIRRATTPLVILIAGSGVLFWFGKGGWLKTVVFLLFVSGLLVLSTTLISRGIHLPIAAAGVVGAISFAGRLGSEGVRVFREKMFLRRTFGNYVSPDVLKEILAGRIRPGLGGSRKHICVLFSDVRGFTERSERMSPESVITLLNEYFSVMAATVHRHGGTVDKFIGDGMMALFGVPQSLPAPERVALETAREMLGRLDEVNAAICERGLEPIRMGIGIHCGEAVVGHVGSDTRHEYTAIGDVVNVASRLEGLTKDVSCPIVCSAEVAAMVGNDFPLTDLGERSIKGHSMMRLYGWKFDQGTRNAAEAVAAKHGQE